MIILPFTRSDHFPNQLIINVEAPKGGSSFRFKNIWIRDVELHGLIKTWWSEVRMGDNSRLYMLSQKLSYIKNKLKEWNKENFKNIFTKKAWVEEELRKLSEKFIERGIKKEDFEKEQNLKLELAEIMVKEETFWCQKSRETWLKEGDRNKIFS